MATVHLTSTWEQIDAVASYIKANLLLPHGVLATTLSVGNQPSRADLDACLLENNHTVPLSGNANYVMVDFTGKVFSIHYVKAIDKYGFEKLTTR